MATITGTNAANKINAVSTVSDDGRAIDEAESAATAQSVANDLATIRDHFGGALATFVHQPWLVAGVAATGSGAQSTIPMDGSGSMYLPAPNGSKLVAITIRVIPTAHANLPGTMPKFRLFKIDGVTGASTTLFTKTDPSGSTVAYNAAHNVTQTLGTPEVIDHVGHVYVLQFNGESGTDKDDLLIGQPILSLS
jgi:hypothetical protein